jgi:hypothetical protein
VGRAKSARATDSGAAATARARDNRKGRWCGGCVDGGCGEDQSGDIAPASVPRAGQAQASSGGPCMLVVGMGGAGSSADRRRWFQPRCGFSLAKTKSTSSAVKWPTSGFTIYL